MQNIVIFEKNFKLNTMINFKRVTIAEITFGVDYEVSEADHDGGYQGGEIEINYIYHNGTDFKPLFDELDKLNEILELLK